MLGSSDQWSHLKYAFTCFSKIEPTGARCGRGREESRMARVCCLSPPPAPHVHWRYNSKSLPLAMVSPPVDLLIFRKLQSERINWRIPKVDGWYGLNVHCCEWYDALTRLPSLSQLGFESDLHFVQHAQALYTTCL